MNADVLKGAGIDYDRGVKRFIGRAHLYEKVLAKFPKDATFDRIRAAHAAKDAGQLFASAHEFKGVCGNISLTRLYGATDALVTLLRAGVPSPAILESAYSLLESEYGIVCEAIRVAMEDTK